MVHINRLNYNSVATSSSRNGITKISSPRVARYRRDRQYLWHPIPITKQRRTPPRQPASITRMPWVDTGESNNNNNKLRLRSNKEGKRKGKEKGDEGGGGGGGGGENFQAPRERYGESYNHFICAYRAK